MCIDENGGFRKRSARQEQKREDFWKQRSVFLVWTAKTKLSENASHARHFSRLLACSFCSTEQKTARSVENADVTTNYAVSVSIPDDRGPGAIEACAQDSKKVWESLGTQYSFFIP